MKYTIDLPDALPKEQAIELIRRFEQQTRAEVELVDSQDKKNRADAMDRLFAWTEVHRFKLEGGIPSREELQERQARFMDFLDWSDQNMISVEDCTIPSREERNAR